MGEAPARSTRTSKPSGPVSVHTRTRTRPTPTTLGEPLAAGSHGSVLRPPHGHPVRRLPQRQNVSYVKKTFLTASHSNTSDSAIQVQATTVLEVVVKSFFLQKKRFIEHMLSCEKSFSCDICLKKFGRREDHNSHMKKLLLFSPSCRK